MLIPSSPPCPLPLLPSPLPSAPPSSPILPSPTDALALRPQLLQPADGRVDVGLRPVQLVRDVHVVGHLPVEDVLVLAEDALHLAAELPLEVLEGVGTQRWRAETGGDGTGLKRSWYRAETQTVQG